MDTTRIQAMREEMERAHARRLQPHYIQAFFLDAFKRLGGQMHPREPGRWEITHVPAAVRQRDRHIGMGAPVLKRYERVCFEKDKVEAAVLLHPHVVDPENWFQVYGAFDFDANKRKVRERVGQ